MHGRPPRQPATQRPRPVQREDLDRRHRLYHAVVGLQAEEAAARRYLHAAEVKDAAGLTLPWLNARRELGQSGRACVTAPPPPASEFGIRRASEAVGVSPSPSLTAGGVLTPPGGA